MTLTPEQIIAEPAGPTLDVAVHRALGRQCEYFAPTPGECGSDLCGWYDTPLRAGELPTPVPRYSTDIAAAFALIDWWRDPENDGGSGEVEMRCEGEPDDGAWVVHFGIISEGIGNTLPLAICRAVLLVKMREGQGA